MALPSQPAWFGLAWLGFDKIEIKACSFFHDVCIYNWTTSNAYISVNSQPILVKFWILHLMTNLNKVYDTTPNLKRLKSQLISTTSNA